MDQPKDDQSLERLMALLTDPESWSSAAAPIVLHKEGKPLVIVTLIGPDGKSNGACGARAFLSVAPINSAARPDPSLLTQVFGLTAAEARLGAILARGHSLDEAAAELNIARETVRSQLKSIFAKTGTHRQSEVVALLARL